MRISIKNNGPTLRSRSQRSTSQVAQLLLRQCHALGVENPLAVEDDLGRTCSSVATRAVFVENSTGVKMWRIDQPGILQKVRGILYHFMVNDGDLT